MTPALDHLVLLERHQARVRGLVRALLRDEHATEDVMQDAWVRALTSQPRDPRTTGAWFARVAERLALNRLRGGRRRDRRERAAARDEALPSSAEIAARVELGRVVLDALEDLPAQHRAVLRDRYLGELTPTELARRDGLSVETVKSRLVRARAALKQRLDAESFDGGWQRALMPFVGVSLAAPSAVAPSTLTLSGLGALALNKVVLAVAVLSFVALGLWHVVGEMRPVDGGGGTVVAATPAPTAGGDPVAEQEAVVPAAPDDASPLDSQRAAATTAGSTAGQAWVVEGRVALTTGAAPARPVAVTLTVYEGFEASGAPLHRAVVTPGAQGSFRWELPAPAVAVTATAWVEDDDYLTLSVPAQTTAPGEAPPIFEIQLLPRDATLEGLVRAVDGAPIEGARVRWGGFTAETDARGGYRLRVSHRWLYRIIAEADGHGLVEGSMSELEPGAVARLDFTLARELVITGKVLDERGLPVEGATVATFHHSDRVSRSDAQGRYRLEGLSRDVRASVTVYARSSGFCQADERCDVPAVGDLVQDLVLRRGARVAGLVRGPDGRPVAGAEAWIGRSRHAFGRLEAVSDGGGRLAFEAVPAGTHRLTVEHEGSPPGSVDFHVPAGASHVQDLVVELATGRTLRGVVRDAWGKPLEDVGVSAQAGRQYVNSHARTGADGRFELMGLPAGQLRVETYALGWVGGERVVPRDHVGEVELTMRPAGRLSGRVIDGATGAPVTVFTIRVVDPVLEEGDSYLGSISSVWSERGKSFDDPEGRWYLGDEEFAPGSVTGIEASASGYAPAVEPRAVVPGAGEEADVVLVLRRPVEVSVQVLTDADGAPVEGARVVATQVERASDEDPRWSGTTDSAGSCALSDLPPGILWISIARPERLTQQYGPFQLRHDDAHQRLEVRMPVGASLHGLVLDERDGAARPGVEVVLSALEVEGVSELAPRATSGADGRYRFDDLPPGLYQLSRIQRRGEHETNELSLKVRIAPDSTVVEQDLVAPRGSGAIRGRVVCDGELQPGLVVALLERDGDLPPVRATLVDDEGRFVFEHLPPRSFVVTAMQSVRSTGQFLHGAAEAPLSAGEQVEIQLELEPLN